MFFFTNKEGHAIVEAMIAVIQQNKEYLSDIHGAIGDGDHGIHMNKGVALASVELAKKDSHLSIWI